ncbi:hypothetical protein SODALDRAFT_117066 [Sodiomyces alkalinus F11]|uniref:Uncharacterized protein n=1 Tax=Sodiomyces alkalinus (strain CBS 110278 / VKM F-3762 / F11) TaxID=1314773 RepID=A0A3N2Q3I6_SODAK|nr:hypothetical protein SODALDRAFT_117066 [Sodiomyces alkalinus F11]ROT41331.1 hypothetical protein SODALDRAFT_117066 [Sodiomyces alkalinus F11]
MATFLDDTWTTAALQRTLLHHSHHGLSRTQARIPLSCINRNANVGDGVVVGFGTEHRFARSTVGSFRTRLGRPVDPLFYVPYVHIRPLSPTVFVLPLSGFLIELAPSHVVAKRFPARKFCTWHQGLRQKWLRRPLLIGLAGKEIPRRRNGLFCGASLGKIFRLFSPPFHFLLQRIAIWAKQKQWQGRLVSCGSQKIFLLFLFSYPSPHTPEAAAKGFPSWWIDSTWDMGCPRTVYGRWRLFVYFPLPSRGKVLDFFFPSLLVAQRLGRSCGR